jgi:hypothetical protein
MARTNTSIARVVEETGAFSRSALVRRLRGALPFDVAELAAVAAVLDVPIAALVPDAKPPVDAA